MEEACIHLCGRVDFLACQLHSRNWHIEFVKWLMQYYAITFLVVTFHLLERKKERKKIDLKMEKKA